ncbi:MAG TPA: polysaccharide deacetylase family protein [Candidatus Eremiobacteraceae bacterium]|nr:polysaccharide deacetylase family protein [Candidatus Eremiobacteraceae bacterium]
MRGSSTPRSIVRPWRLWSLITVILAVVLCVLWYSLENPKNQTFGHTVTGVPIHQKVVALTFDDGPNPPYTNQIVDYLAAQQVPATFFVVGRAVAAHPDVVRKEVQAGNALGNHSWDHAHLVLERSRHIQQEIEQTDAIIRRVTGVHTNLFRPPFGARDYAVVNVARRMGYQVIMWSEPLPKDWQGPPPTVIRDRVLRYVKDGDIIVLHDGNRGKGGNRQNTVEATKLIVEALRARGYRFVTVPELLRLGYLEGSKETPSPVVPE